MDYWDGDSWESFSAGGGTASSLADADGNTLIQVEESANEHILRFDTGGTERMVIDASGNVGIGTTTPQATLDVAGDIFYSGIVRDTSNRRAKTQIQSLGPTLDRLNQLEAVSFVMKDDPKKRKELGLIAQDVQKVFPELVDASANGTLGMHYTGLIGPLIEAFKELDQENEDLRQMIKELSNRLDSIERKRQLPTHPYNR